MTENKKRFRIEFTVDAEGWSDKFIKDSAIQELTCMVPYPEDITFSEANSWHTGTPTEKGLYVVLTKVSMNGVSSSEGTYILDYWDGYSFQYLKRKALVFSLIEPDIYSWVKWQKIEEKEDGRTD